MPRIGIYIGMASDPIENVEGVLHAWGKYLNEFQIDAFGSARLPSECSKYYTKVETEPKYYTRSSDDENESLRSEYELYNDPFSKIVGAYRDYVEYIRKRSPDVLIQLWEYVIHGPAAAIAGKVSGIPTVTRYAGSSLETRPAFGSVREFTHYFIGDVILGNVIGRIPICFSDRMIVLGPNSKSQVLSARVPFSRISEEDITLLPPPARIESRFSPPESRSEMRNEIGIPDKKTALFVGRLTEEKGMEFLHDVINSTLETNDIQFLLVGEGPYKEFFESTFDDNVITVGYVDHDAIHKYYRASDVYVHPSPLEGIPLVMLEAFSCNVPVVARDAGDIGFVTNYVVESSREMADHLVNNTYEMSWENREFFEDDYQRTTLKSIVRELSD